MGTILLDLEIKSSFFVFPFDVQIMEYIIYTMNNVEFEEEGRRGQRESLLYARFQKSVTAPTIVTFLIKRSIVKNEHQATVLLISLIVVCLIGSLLLFKNISGTVALNPDKVIKAVVQIPHTY